MSLQQGFITDFGSMESRHCSWNLHLRRDPNDSELSELIDLLAALSQVNLSNGKDKLVWLSDNKGVFSIRNCYKYLMQSSNSALSTRCFPYEFIWNGKIPARINFFLWEVNVDVVLTKVRISRSEIVGFKPALIRLNQRQLSTCC